MYFCQRQNKEKRMERILSNLLDWELPVLHKTLLRRIIPLCRLPRRMTRRHVRRLRNDDDVNFFLADYTRFGTISNGSDANYYSSPPPVREKNTRKIINFFFQQHERFGTLSSPPPSMMVPGNVGTINRPIPGSFIRPPQQDSYDAPPLPPPPPGSTSYSNGYDEPPPPPDYGYNK